MINFKIILEKANIVKFISGLFCVRFLSIIINSSLTILFNKSNLLDAYFLISSFPLNLFYLIFHDNIFYNLSRIYAENKKESGKYLISLTLYGIFFILICQIFAEQIIKFFFASELSSYIENLTKILRISLLNLLPIIVYNYLIAILQINKIFWFSAAPTIIFQIIFIFAIKNIQSNDIYLLMYFVFISNVFAHFAGMFFMILIAKINKINMISNQFLNFKDIKNLFIGPFLFIPQRGIVKFDKYLDKYLLGNSNLKQNEFGLSYIKCATSVSHLITDVGLAIEAIFLPEFLKNNDTKVLNFALKYMILIGFLVIIFIFIFAKKISIFCFDNNLYDHNLLANIILIKTISYFLKSLSNIIFVYYYSKLKFYNSFYINLIACGFKSMAIIYLFKNFGIIGLVYAGLISNLIKLLVSLLFLFFNLFFKKSSILFH